MKVRCVEIALARAVTELELIREILTPRSSEGTESPNPYYANY